MGFLSLRRLPSSGRLISLRSRDWRTMVLIGRWVHSGTGVVGMHFRLLDVTSELPIWGHRLGVPKACHWGISKSWRFPRTGDPQTQTWPHEEAFVGFISIVDIG